MNLFYTSKQNLKNARWRMRRWFVSNHWDSETLLKTPAVFANSMPKSGSHLIIQILRGLTKIGPFVDPGFPPVNRSENNQKLPQDQVIRNIQHMKPGDIGYGYIHCCEPFITMLAGEMFATIFVYRDPRDVLISHVYYATDMHEGHGMHTYYNQTLQSMEQRINAAISGVNVNGSELAPIKVKYENYLGWLKVPGVLSLQFEELVLERSTAVDRILDFVEMRGFIPVVSRSKSVEVLELAVAPHQSGTFRKGQPGGWRDHFTQANKELFKEKTGNLLVTLGYEQNDNW